MLRGTRIITGDEARLQNMVTHSIRLSLIENGYQEVILPSLWEQQTFIDKAGHEILGQMGFGYLPAPDYKPAELTINRV